MRADRARRDAARRWGRWSEWLAEALLRAKGFRILARRHRVRGGEIDLIARRGDLVLFVEVKARPTLLEAAEAVTSAKRRFMGRAARQWLASHPSAARCRLRADAVLVTPWAWPRHVAGVIELDLD